MADDPNTVDIEELGERWRADKPERWRAGWIDQQRRDAPGRFSQERLTQRELKAFEQTAKEMKP